MTLNDINADISIRSIQEVMGEMQTSLTIEEAYFTKKRDKYYLIYNERDENGMSENKVRLIASDDGVTVMRSGSINAKLVYKINEKTETNYRLSYGVLNVEVFTRSIEMSEKPNGLNLKMEYDVSIGEEKLKTSLEINVEKRSNE